MLSLPGGMELWSDHGLIMVTVPAMIAGDPGKTGHYLVGYDGLGASRNEWRTHVSTYIMIAWWP